MGRRPRVPPKLKLKPFTLSEARSAGLSLSSLKGKRWARLGSELYCWSELQPDPWHVLAAWHRSLPGDVVFAGATAAWMLGLDFDATNPVEVVLPLGSGVRSRPGLRCRRCDLETGESIFVRGLPATNLPRTLLDFCLTRLHVEALVAIDMALHRELIDIVELWRYAQQAGSRPGAARLRRLTTIAEPAESPMETRLRWLLLEAGLPRPQVQAEVRDPSGRFLGRADLYYRAARLILEFDGRNHRDRLVDDDRRQNLLIGSGHRILRFTTADLRNQPDLVVGQVRAALATERLAPNGRKISA